MFPHRPLSVGIGLIIVIELLDQNATDQLNQTELGEWAMKKFNLYQSLAQQAISNNLNNAETSYSNNNVVNNGKSLKTTRYPQLDDEVVKFVADMNNNNLPVNRDSILRYVRPIASVKYRILGNEISFSSGWLTKLFKRIGVKYRPMHGESASVDITSENIQNELRKVEELLEPYDPIDIMNFDETGLYYQQPPRKTICPESLANTTSKLQTLHAGIIDNFKAHFRAQQYGRALCLYISKKLDNPNAYKMDQAQAMVFLANEWLKVKPETINGMLPDLPGKFDNKITDVNQLNLEADESEMIVCYTTSITNNEETAEGNIDETEKNDNTEQDEQCVDIVECKNRLREAYETIIMYEVPLDDLDRKLHRRIRMRLADSYAELNKSKEQADF
ncbi:hypothetical protein G6F53_003496 [Rhizopus delemar]|uniref:HTH CENPB-type domain-containing protein n=1 Tax=Rhizopus oryzae TaxID=64495 RepID=A0A9P6YG99_RHIOR|nr:hypothetical protein G6F53_003496 [Rhizopus delemar]KAG1521121.1 hypothetical protein G6F52_007028 [Rhizopus delemar]KAG1547770.1 hypothetical protein G6F51_004064 [Rhizopus arrhizus]